MFAFLCPPMKNMAMFLMLYSHIHFDLYLCHFLLLAHPSRIWPCFPIIYSHVHLHLFCVLIMSCLPINQEYDHVSDDLLPYPFYVCLDSYVLLAHPSRVWPCFLLYVLIFILLYLYSYVMLAHPSRKWPFL